MLATHRYEIDSYRVTANRPLTADHLDILAAAFEDSGEARAENLHGRKPLTRIDLEDIGAAVVKHYRRGGLLRRVNRRIYVRCGKTRPCQEFEFLEAVGRLGIAAPQPLAWVTKGAFFYRGWLVMRRIDHVGNLVDACRQDRSLAKAAMGEMSTQIGLLLRHNVFHVDLHPGNIVLTRNGGLYITDWDKGTFYSGGRQKLIGKYRARWNRSVEKYALPDFLRQMMDAALATVID